MESLWFFSSPVRTIAVTTASVSASESALALLKMLKFLVKVFRVLYLLNPWMDLVSTLPDVRYWSEVLCCTITTHISDPEVKVTDLEILSSSFWLKFFFSTFLLWKHFRQIVGQTSVSLVTLTCGSWSYGQHNPDFTVQWFCLISSKTLWCMNSILWDY